MLVLILLWGKEHRGNICAKGLNDFLIEKKYNLIVLDNNSGTKESEIESFNYELLLKDFKKPLNLRKVNYKRYKVFGFLFTVTSIENNTELATILTSDLKKYITLQT